MRSDDIQSYVDGTMSAEDREHFEAALEESPVLREELAGFQAFRHATKAATATDEVPTERLESILKSVIDKPAKAPKPRFHWVNVFVPVAAMLVLAFGIRWLRTDRVNLATTPEAEQSTISTVADAERYIESTTDIDLPKFDFERDVTPVMARVGEGQRWVCVDFEKGSTSFILYVSQDASPLLRSGHQRQEGGRTFYDGHGTGWIAHGLAFYLKGGDEGTRREIAQSLARQM